MTFFYKKKRGDKTFLTHKTVVVLLKISKFCTEDGKFTTDQLAELSPLFKAKTYLNYVGMLYRNGLLERVEEGKGRRPGVYRLPHTTLDKIINLDVAEEFIESPRAWTMLQKEFMMAALEKADKNNELSSFDLATILKKYDTEDALVRQFVSGGYLMKLTKGNAKRTARYKIPEHILKEMEQFVF